MTGGDARDTELLSKATGGREVIRSGAIVAVVGLVGRSAGVDVTLKHRDSKKLDTQSGLSGLGPLRMEKPTQTKVPQKRP